MNVEDYINEPGKPVRIWEGDCLEFMPGLGDGSVDFALADPQYNVALRYRDGTPDDDLSDEDYRAQVAEWYAELRRVAQTFAVTVGGRNIWCYPRADAVLSWDKIYSLGGVSAYSKHAVGSRWEPILCWGAPKRRWPVDVLRHFTNRRKDVPAFVDHPGCKPESLVSDLVSHFTDEGDLVLDPFLGSGTTAVVCDRLGRRRMGCEINPDYVQMATERIEKAREQLKLPMEVGT